MAMEAASGKTQTGQCLEHSSVQEEGAVAHLTIENSKKTKGEIFTTDPQCKMETLTTSKATYVPPRGPGVRLRGSLLLYFHGAGIRRELLEKHLTQMIREKMLSEMSPAAPETDYSSTTQKDFCVPGFVPSRPKSTQVHDYKSQQAITFWSENCKQIQGVTPIRNLKAPFRKSAMFSTPITERLDEEDLLSDK